MSSPSLVGLKTPPSSLDYRALNKVSSIKGSYDCMRADWAFTAISALESQLMIQRST